MQNDHYVIDFFICPECYIAGLFRTSIPRQPLTMPPILNRLFRTTTDTCHTMRTIFSPHRFPVIHMDIPQRTHICTFSAGDTGVRCVKLLCMNKHRIKDIVDNAAVYFIFYGKMTLRELFSVLYQACGIVYMRFCKADGFQRVFSAGSGEHGYIILRHEEGKAS